MGDPPVLVGLGYNGMPDGEGFKDCGMPWNKHDSKDYRMPCDKHDFGMFFKSSDVIHSFIYHCNYVLKTVCHAEMNAIISALRRQADFPKDTTHPSKDTAHLPEGTEGSTLYVTHSPCAECCKLIIKCGVKNVIYAKEYWESVEPYVESVKEENIK